MVLLLNASFLLFRYFFSLFYIAPLLLSFRVTRPISTAEKLTLTPGTECTGTCPYGDDCECVHTITYNHTVSNMRLIYAGGHCHAPSCIGIWLYRNDPGIPVS